MSTPIRNIAYGFIGCLILGSYPTWASDQYPVKPVKLLVGFATGGPTDIPARFIAQKLGSMLGQNVVVENKPGASGLVATRDMLSQPRDGYTLLFCTHYDAINSVFYKDAGYRLTDIAPISLVSKYYRALTVSNSLPVNSFEQFVQYAKAHPGQINYATIGAVSPQEIVAHQLEKLAEISMARVPFRSGPQAVPELLAGRIQFYVAPTLAAVPLYEAGKIKIVAVSSPERLSEIPEVPTLREEKIDYSPLGWLGVCTGSQTPKWIVDLLNRDIGSIIATSGYRNLIKKGGAIPVASTPAQLKMILAQTADEARSVISEFGLKQ